MPQDSKGLMPEAVGAGALVCMGEKVHMADMETVLAGYQVEVQGEPRC